MINIIEDARGIKGSFYTSNRLHDLIEAAKEVILENSASVGEYMIKNKKLLDAEIRTLLKIITTGLIMSRMYCTIMSSHLE